MIGADVRPNWSEGPPPGSLTGVQWALNFGAEVRQNMPAARCSCEVHTILRRHEVKL
jgi:hypothetical protein